MCILAAVMLKQTLETPSTHPFADFRMNGILATGVHQLDGAWRRWWPSIPCHVICNSSSFRWASQLQAGREGLSIAGRFWVGTLGYLESKNDLQVKWRWGFTQRWLNIASSSSCWCCCCWWWWWWWWRATKRIWRVESKMPIHHQRRASRGPNRSVPFLPRLRFFIRYFFRCLGASQAWKHSTLFCFFLARNPGTTPFLAVGCPGAPNKWTSTWRWLLADVKSISLLWAMDQWRECHFCRPFLSISDRLDLKDCSQKWWLVDVGGAYVKRHWVSSESMEFYERNPPIFFK